jgi:ankyrin repeat protein
MSRICSASAFLFALALLAPATAVTQAESRGNYVTAPEEMVESTGVTDLMWVAGNHSVDELEALIATKDSIDPAALDFFGNTALHYVAFYANDPAAIDLLLEIEVPVDVVNAQGFTAFEIMQGNENLRGTDPYMVLLKQKLEKRSDE